MLQGKLSSKVKKKKSTKKWQNGLIQKLHSYQTTQQLFWTQFNSDNFAEQFSR
jgi:hypothetical protein